MKNILLLSALILLMGTGCNTNGKPNDNDGEQTENEDGKGKKKKKGKKSDKDAEEGSASGNSAIKVLQLWKLPATLKEVSGIVWYDTDKIACIQDESGKIFIYDLKKSAVERVITFAGVGDFEGIAYTGKLFYVLRSDGAVIQVEDKDKPAVKEFKTFLGIKQDTEGMCFDQSNNSLLITIKAADPSETGKKGIYVFDLVSMKMKPQPLAWVDLSASEFSSGKSKNPNQVFQPSGIAIDPVSKDIYITDGPNSTLIVLSSNGSIKSYQQLDKTTFPQPEGLTFSPEGKLYLSSEAGGKGTGIIANVENE